MKTVFKEITIILDKAYMRLYDALVDMYKADKQPCGMAQFNAIQDMYMVVSAVACGPRKIVPGMVHLVMLYNTHKSVVAHNTMVSKNKDKIMPIIVDYIENLDNAITNFEQAIKKAERHMSTLLKPDLPEIPELDIRSILVGPKKMPKGAWRVGGVIKPKNRKLCKNPLPDNSQTPVGFYIRQSKSANK